MRACGRSGHSNGIHSARLAMWLTCHWCLCFLQEQKPPKINHNIQNYVHWAKKNTQGSCEQMTPLPPFFSPKNGERNQHKIKTKTRQIGFKKKNKKFWLSKYVCIRAPTRMWISLKNIQDYTSSHLVCTIATTIALG